MPILSVIVPVFNESKTVKEILDKINLVNIDKEIVVVDDGSTDGTEKILKNLHASNMKIIYHSTNRGKGAAFLTGLANATGEFVIIQDADLEYDPVEYLKLFDAIKDDKADLVLGARFTKGYTGLYMHRLGNKFLTGFFNLLFGTKINDYLTCYKLFRRDVANALDLKSSTFDIEAEIVAKFCRKSLRIAEVPVSYYPRKYSEGKKIRWSDGIHAILAIVKYRFGD